MILLYSSCWIVIIILSLQVPNVNTEELSCLDGCICNEEEKSVKCEGPQIRALPLSVPSGFDIFILRNATIRCLDRESFRKMDRLREVHIENCDQFDRIDKFAFKGMRKLRLISIRNASKLVELFKASFSGISNQFALKIVIEAPINTIHPGAFRHSRNIRELTITGLDMTIQTNAFSCISQLDFLSISGISRIEPQLFTNSSRFYMIHIHSSQFEIPNSAFADLSHVHQLIIQRSKLPLIATDAFSGISTVEKLELFDNSIGSINAHAFSGIINLGQLTISRNVIQNMESPESILAPITEMQLRFNENTISCSCDIKWMGAHPIRSVGDSNYCGTIGVHRTVSHYVRIACTGARSTYTEGANTNTKQIVSNQRNPTKHHTSLNVYTVVIMVFIAFLVEYVR